MAALRPYEGPAPWEHTGQSGVAPAARLALSDVGAVLDMLSDAVVVVAEDGALALVNRQAERMFGAPRSELVGRSVDALVPEASRGAHQHLRGRYWSWPDARPHGVSRELTVRRAGGELSPVEISLSMLEVVEGSFAVASLRDVGDARNELVGLRREHEALRVRFEALERRNRGLAAVSMLARVLQSMEAEAEVHRLVAENGPVLFPRLSGQLVLHDPSHVRPTVVAAWGPGVPGGDVPGGGATDDDAAAVANHCWALRLGRICGARYPERSPRCAHVGGTGDYLCVPLMAQDQSMGALHLSASAGGLPIDDEDEALASVLADNIAMSVANFRLRLLLQSQAVKDPLSGLFNRRYMEAALEKEIKHSARHGRPFSFVLLDVNKFKQLNDSYGHDAADALLRELSAFLERNIRAEDTACRYGGDELALILPDTPGEGAVVKARSLQVGISDLEVSHLGQLLPQVTVEVGVSSYPSDGMSAASLFRAADVALLRAKASRGLAHLHRHPMEHRPPSARSGESAGPV